jgi:hypothetical protein
VIAIDMSLQRPGGIETGIAALFLARKCRLPKMFGSDVALKSLMLAETQVAVPTPKPLSALMNGSVPAEPRCG